jgi:membrane protein implicated in regulation of membrane protease activity
MRYGGLLLLLLVICVVVRYAVWIGLAAAAIVLAVVLWKFTGWLDRRLERRERRREAALSKRAAVAHRADTQHTWVLAGDERGTYGEYPPKSFPGQPEKDW